MRTFWRNSPTLSLSLLGFGFTLLAWGFLHLGFLGPLRGASADTFVRWRNALQPAPAQVQQILLIAVDDESQRKLNQKWPWDRSVFTDLLRRVGPFQPKGVLFDFAFVGAGRPESDAALAQAIREGPPTLLAGYQDPRGELMLPLADFLAAGGTLGMINKPLDPDRVIRRIWTQLPFSTTAGPVYGIEFQAAMLLWGTPIEQIHRASSGWTLGERRVPTGNLGELRINYLALPEEIPTFPLWRVLEGSVPTSQFRDRLLIVGPVREITHDIHPTPLGRIPGIAISANGLLTFLTQRYLRSLPGWVLFPLALLTVLAFLFVSFHSRWTVGLLLAGLGMALSVLGGFGLTCLDIFAEAVSPILFIGGAWGIGFLTKHVGLVTGALRLQRQAITDQISGAVTSRYFRLRLEQEVRSADPQQDPVSILLVGIGTPSQLLQDHPWEEVQRRMKMLVSFLRLGLPPDCLVGRLDEDRFGLLLPHLGLGKGQGTAQRLRQNLPFSGRGIFAIGLASLEQNPQLKGQGLLQCAEHALRRALSKGYGSIEVYDPMLDAAPSVSSQKPESTARPGYLEYVASELEERNLALEKALTDLRQAHNRLEEAFLEVTKSLVFALETKDPYTAGHVERVCRYAGRLSELLHLPPAEVEEIREAALLHDIGKIGLPDEVLHKIGTLTSEERQIIRQHLAIGAKILEPMKFFKSITALVTHHHERYDGKGYPDGLAGDAIPAGAQMIAIADAFDAMTTHRGYNQPKSIPEALAELRKGAGSQFNPIYVEKFTEMILREGTSLTGTLP